MKTITSIQFNGSTAELQARIDAFNQAKIDHASTVGVAAPREEDWIEELARSGEAFAVVPPDQDPPPPPATVAAAQLEAKRQLALRDLDEKRLLDAALDPQAPQTVKDYDAAIKARG